MCLASKKTDWPAVLCLSDRVKNMTAEKETILSTHNVLLPDIYSGALEWLLNI